MRYNKTAVKSTSYKSISSLRTLSEKPSTHYRFPTTPSNFLTPFFTTPLTSSGSGSGSGSPRSAASASFAYLRLYSAGVSFSAPSFHIPLLACLQNKSHSDSVVRRLQTKNVLSFLLDCVVELLRVPSVLSAALFVGDDPPCSEHIERDAFPAHKEAGKETWFQIGHRNLGRIH